MKQLVADLKTAVALGKESVTTQFVEVQVRVNEIKKDILRALHDAMQVLENQLKTKFEVRRNNVCVPVCSPCMVYMLHLKYAPALV